MGHGGACFAALLWAAMSASAVAAPATVDHFDLDADGTRTTLRVALSEDSRYRIFALTAPDRVVLDIEPARLVPRALPLPAAAGAVRQVRAANRPDGSVRVVLDMTTPAQWQTTMGRAGRGSQIVVDLSKLPTVQPPVAPPVAAVAEAPARLPVAPVAESADAHPSVTTMAPRASTSAAVTAPSAGSGPAAGGRDIVIAVDAGHGGKDPGAHGPRGVLEKDITLRIARRLVAVIDAEPGMRGVLIRNGDEFIPLRGRMERARAAQADLFVSIHADAVRNRSVRGSSVYVLNEKGATDEAARRLAARENAADLVGGVSLRTRDPTLASVLLDLSQNASLSSSIEVADAILRQMARVGTVRKPQVMQAPFMVLKSPDVPSVLIETAYISNPQEERRLDSDDYRGRLAGAIFAGVRDHFYRNPPRGTLVAELSRKRLAEAVDHVIRPGESLSVIATRYNVSVRRIRAVNQLTSDRLAVGQTLRIPMTQET